MKLFFSKRAVEPTWSEKTVKSIRGDKSEGHLRIEVVGYIRHVRGADDGILSDGLEFFGRVGWAMTINDRMPPGAVIRFRQSDYWLKGRGAVYGGKQTSPDSFTRPMVNVAIKGDEAAETALKEMCDLSAVAGIKLVPMTMKWTIPEEDRRGNDALNFQMQIERYSLTQNLLLFNKSFSQDADMEEAFFTPKR